MTGVQTCALPICYCKDNGFNTLSDCMLVMNNHESSVDIAKTNIKAKEHQTLVKQPQQMKAFSWPKMMKEKVITIGEQ